MAGRMMDNSVRRSGEKSRPSVGMAGRDSRSGGSRGPSSPSFATARPSEGETGVECRDGRMLHTPCTASASGLHMAGLLWSGR